VRDASPHRPKNYAVKCLRLMSYLRSPGDGRPQARIPASALVWALLMGTLLRRLAFAAIEALVCSGARVPWSFPAASATTPSVILPNGSTQRDPPSSGHRRA
jgi:hypothetical protein